MSYSLLGKLDSYIAKNDFKIKTFTFDVSVLPRFVKLALLNEIRILNDTYFDEYNPTIKYAYDLYGNPYFLLHDVRNLYNIIIVRDRDLITVNFKKDLVIKESYLMHNASLIEYLSKHIDAYRKKILINNPHINNSKRELLEYKELNRVIPIANKKLLAENKNVTSMFDNSKKMHYSFNLIIKDLDEEVAKKKEKIK